MTGDLSSAAAFIGLHSQMVSHGNHSHVLPLRTCLECALSGSSPLTLPP